MIDLQDWKARNPLRAWRRAHNVTAFEVAARMGVSVQAMARWEGGAAMPNTESLAGIATMMGRGDEDADVFAAEWQAWRDEIKTKI